VEVEWGDGVIISLGIENSCPKQDLKVPIGVEAQQGTQCGDGAFGRYSSELGEHVLQFLILLPHRLYSQLGCGEE
jgi:hypothetical protein